MVKYGPKYALALVINLSVAAGLYLIPGIPGYGWNAHSLIVHHVKEDD